MRALTPLELGLGDLLAAMFTLPPRAFLRRGCQSVGPRAHPLAIIDMIYCHPSSQVYFNRVILPISLFLNLRLGLGDQF